MRGTECDYHGSSTEPFRYGEREFCWKCESEMLTAIDAVKRVRELHKPMKETNKNGFVNIFCEGCPDDNVNWGTTFYAHYPCPTIKALNGDQS